MKNDTSFSLRHQVNRQLCRGVMVTILSIASSPLLANSFPSTGIQEVAVNHAVTQQKVKITGKVIDTVGEPLPGAAVVIHVMIKIKLQMDLPQWDCQIA